MKKFTPCQSQINSRAKRVVPWSFALLSLLAASAHGTEPLDCLIEPHVLVDVSSSEIGVLASVGVDEADVVREGDAIATLQTDVERATFEVTRARARADREIELLRREHDFYTRKRDRIDELNKQRVVSAQDVDEVRTAQDAAWLRLEAAEEQQHAAQLEATRDELALARRTVYSPIDGVVVRRYKSTGEFVDGDPIVQLAQLDPLRIRVIVPISMFGQIQVGMRASIVPELPLAGPFVASVVSIDAMMDAATATLGVKLSLPNREHGVPPGLRCSLVFHPLEMPLAQTQRGADSDTAAVKIPTLMLPSPDLPPVIGAATMSEPVADVPPVTALKSPTAEASPSAKESTGSVTVLAGSAGEDSCVTLGPLHGSAVADTVSAVLNASDMHFVRRYTTEEDKRTAESTLWLDVVGNTGNPMHVALMGSIRDYYPELLELPIDCSQLESR